MKAIVLVFLVFVATVIAVDTVSKDLEASSTEFVGYGVYGPYDGYGLGYGVGLDEAGYVGLEKLGLGNLALGYSGLGYGKAFYGGYGLGTGLGTGLGAINGLGGFGYSKLGYGNLGYGTFYKGGLGYGGHDGFYKTGLYGGFRKY